MIVCLDRRGGTMAGGGVVVRVDPSGDVLRLWCRAAMAQGYDLDGMPLEMWDTGAVIGEVRRKHGMLCMTISNAAALVQPSVDKAAAKKRKTTK